MFSRRKQVDARGRDWDESPWAYETFIAIEQNWGVLIKFLKSLFALVLIGILVSKDGFQYPKCPRTYFAGS